MFTDLERGAVAVVKSMGRESSKTVGHKYGEDAGKVADDSMTAAAHGINLAYVSLCFMHRHTYIIVEDIHLETGILKSKKVLGRHVESCQILELRLHIQNP
jgi:hypothetical protein